MKYDMRVCPICKKVFVVEANFNDALKQPFQHISWLICCVLLKKFEIGREMLILNDIIRQNGRERKGLQESEMMQLTRDFSS